MVPRERYADLQLDVLLTVPRYVLAQAHLRQEAQRVLHQQHRGALARREDRDVEDAQIHPFPHVQ